MSTAAPTRVALGLRVTPEQHRIVAEAAAREHRSLNSFVLKAALQAAASSTQTPRRSPEDIMAMIKAAQEEISEANPSGRDLLQELINERRAESASE